MKMSNTFPGEIMKKCILIVLCFGVSPGFCASNPTENMDEVKRAYSSFFGSSQSIQVAKQKEILQKLGAPEKVVTRHTALDLKSFKPHLNTYAAKDYRRHRGVARNFFHLPRWQHVAAGLGFGGLTIGGYHFMGKAAHKLNWVALERHVLRQRLLEQFGHANHKEIRAALRDKAHPLEGNLRIIAERYLQVDREFKKLNAQWYASLAAFLIGGAGGLTTLVKHYRDVRIDEWLPKPKTD